MKKFLRSFSKDKLLFLTILSFVFIASCALVVTKREEITKLFYNGNSVNDLPVLSADSNFPIISAQGALAVDIESGVTLYEKNPDLKLLPASTTKIMTALVALDYYSLNDVITVGQPGVPPDSQRLGLVTGEQMTFENLLYGLLVYSASDAAMTIAQNYPGGVESFVSVMNQKASEFHLEHTHFSNPIGLDGGENESTARDMTRLSEIAMQNPEFAKVVGTKQIVIKSVDQKFAYPLSNINQLLGKVDGVLGVKTGWTENARENLVTYIERDNRKIMISVLGSQDRFGETKELINWIFENYKWTKVAFK